MGAQRCTSPVSALRGTAASVGTGISAFAVVLQFFSGVFFAVDRFPAYIQPIAWILPMTHVIEVIRPLVAGHALEPLPALGHILYITALAAAAFVLAYRRFQTRLFD